MKVWQFTFKMSWSWHLKSWRIDMKILKRLLYVLLMIPICTMVFVIESTLLPVIIPAIWVITGSTILRVKVTKGCKSFYVYTITQIVYYSMDKYLTKLLKL